MYPWIHTLHVFFVIAWFTAIFYLPRLFIYHVEMDRVDQSGHARFLVMERRLYLMGHIGMGGTYLFGLWLLHLQPLWLKQGWMHVKLSLILLLTVHYLYCGRIRKALARGERPHSSRWLRLYNEAPTLLLLGILAMVIAKPF